MRKLRTHQNVLTIGFWKNCKLKSDASQLRNCQRKDVDYILVTDSTNQFKVTIPHEAK